MRLFVLSALCLALFAGFALAEPCGAHHRHHRPFVRVLVFPFFRPVTVNVAPCSDGKCAPKAVEPKEVKEKK